MGTLRKTAVVTGLLVVFLAWATNYKVPEGFQEPWKLKILVTGLRILMSATEDVTIEGVNCRIYRPLGTKNKLQPAVVYYHGGGWTFGDINSHHQLTEQLSESLEAVVISVDYRLAPKHLYPAGLDDCYAVVKHVLQNPKEYNIDPNRVALAGDSAGGNLAAAVSIRLRDENVSPRLKVQILLYPALQPWDFQMSSYLENFDDGILTPYFTAMCWNKYALGHENYADDMTKNIVPADAMNEFVSLNKNSKLFSKYQAAIANQKAWSDLEKFFRDPYFSPLAAKSLAGLPTAIVLTLGQDILRDEGILYAERLRAEGTPVVHLHVKSAFHGILSFASALPLDFNITYNAIIPVIQKHL